VVESNKKDKVRRLHRLEGILIGAAARHPDRLGEKAINKIQVKLFKIGLLKWRVGRIGK
jgi:hypothetical protein